MRRALLALAVMILALSACELRAEIDVSDDGSGIVGMVFAVEPEMLALFDQPGLGGDPFAELRSDLADDPVAWNVDEFTEGRLKGIRATFAFASIQDLKDKMAALDSGGNDAAIEDFTIERRDGGWVFDGRSSDPQQQLSTEEIPIPVDQLATLLNIQFRVSLPGKAGSHNADEVVSSGGKTTFVWKPDLRSGGVELHASTSAVGASAPVLPIALGLGSVVLAALLWLRRSRKGAASPGVSIPSDVVTRVAGVSTDGETVTGEPKEDASLPS